MSETIEQLNLKHQEYLQAKITLAKKKEKLFAEGKVGKWGLKQKDLPKPASKEQAFGVMLPKQTSDLLAQRELYALHNHQIYEECHRHTQHLDSHLAPFMLEFMHLQLGISKSTTQHLNAIVDIIREIEKPIFPVPT